MLCQALAQERTTSKEGEQGDVQTHTTRLVIARPGASWREGGAVSGVYALLKGARKILLT